MNSKKDKLLYELALTGLSGDKAKVRNLAIAVSQVLRKDDPQKSQLIAEAVSQTNVGHSPFRARGQEESPTDTDSRAKILECIDFPSDEKPILNEDISIQVNEFIKEYIATPMLLKNGIKPASSLALVGPPGVGKTMLAHYIASQLSKPLYILNLATVVSSFLGKTSQNLKSALDFAKENNAIIFLDEFDSIAKKRDDNADLGELKRIVNVLLMELDNWPANSLLIAATNHPELIDSAIWRRFDQTIHIPLPNKDTFSKQLIKFCPELNSKPKLLLLYKVIFEGESPSNIKRELNKVRRRAIVHNSSIEESLESVAKKTVNRLGKKEKQHLCGKLKELDPDLTLDSISKIVGLSTSTVCYHLNK